MEKPDVANINGNDRVIYTNARKKGRGELNGKM